MENSSIENIRKKEKMLRFENGKIYFSKTAERKFYFGMTIIMLLAGMFYKLVVLP
jgi:hypothetical protein